MLGVAVVPLGRLQKNASRRHQGLHRDGAGVGALALQDHVVDLAEHGEAAQGEEDLLVLWVVLVEGSADLAQRSLQRADGVVGPGPLALNK